MFYGTFYGHNNYMWRKRRKTKVVNIQNVIKTNKKKEETYFFKAKTDEGMKNDVKTTKLVKLNFKEIFFRFCMFVLSYLPSLETQSLVPCHGNCITRDSGNDFRFADFASHTGHFCLIFVGICFIVSFRVDIWQLQEHFWTYFTPTIGPIFEDWDKKDR